MVGKEEEEEAEEEKEGKWEKREKEREIDREVASVQLPRRNAQVSYFPPLLRARRLLKPLLSLAA